MPTHGYRVRFFLPQTNTKHSPLLLTRLCRGSFFRKLWQYFPLKKKYFESLVHSVSSRYSSSKKRLAFTNAVGMVWWSLLPMVFPDVNTWWFICIFSNDVPHPVVALLPLHFPWQALNWCLAFAFYGYMFLEDLDLWWICLSLSLRMYSYTRFTSTTLVFKPFPVSSRHFSQNLSS